jgi:hypothetical protein
MAARLAWTTLGVVLLKPSCSSSEGTGCPELTLQALVTRTLTKRPSEAGICDYENTARSLRPRTRNRKECPFPVHRRGWTP